jgi:hypothetical protein
MMHVVLSGVDELIVVVWVGADKDVGMNVLELENMGSKKSDMTYRDGRWWNDIGDWCMILECAGDGEKMCRERVESLRKLKYLR